MSPDIDRGNGERELERLRADLSTCRQENAVLNAKLDLLSRVVEDLRFQNARLEAQHTECRIGRAVAEERAAAAREAAVRADCCRCGCSGSHRGDSAGGPAAKPGSSPDPKPDPQPSPEPKPVRRKLVIDNMVVQQTPQSGTWLMCFAARSPQGAQNVFNIPNRTYEGDGIVIDMHLVLSPVAEGERITFTCQLDDDQADVCGNEAEDKSAGDFIASEDGSAAFSFDNWVYTLNWHMETA